MIIGIPQELKPFEGRVAIVPAGAKTLIDHGHTVLIEKNAGLESNIPDAVYSESGAIIVETAQEVWNKADMIVKVKEPTASEFDLMKSGQILFAYLHLAAAHELAQELMMRQVTGIGYETVQSSLGVLPLLTPMSRIAGRMSVQVGASYLEKERGGKGVLLGGVPGVRRGRVTIVGGGVVGSNAARVAIGLGAEVTVLDTNEKTLAYLDDIYQGSIHTLYSDPHTLQQAVARADLVVGAVLITGARAPRLVTKAMIETMESGSVIVDVAVDQGGCVETCRPTSHDNPTYTIHDVTHYCVTNMPGAVAYTSTCALTNVTTSYIVAIANQGIDSLIEQKHQLTSGINTYQGQCTHQAVATALGVEYAPLY